MYGISFFVFIVCCNVCNFFILDWIFDGCIFFFDNLFNFFFVFVCYRYDFGYYNYCVQNCFMESGKFRIDNNFKIEYVEFLQIEFVGYVVNEFVFSLYYQCSIVFLFGVCRGFVDVYYVVVRVFGGGDVMLGKWEIYDELVKEYEEKLVIYNVLVVQVEVDGLIFVQV